MKKDAKNVSSSKETEEKQSSNAIVKPEGNSLQIIPVKENEEVVKLKEEIAKLQAKLSQEPQDLEARILYYQEKQEKIKQLEKLENHFMNLKEHEAELKKLETENEFKCDTYELKLESKENYKSTHPLAINNPVLIGEVISFVLTKIEEKIENLKFAIAQ